MKVNIIYKLTSDVYRDGEGNFHNEETYNELCDARNDLDLLLKFDKPRAKKEREQGHNSCCNVHERVFDKHLPDICVTTSLVNERHYYKLTYEIYPSEN